ncbi:MAG: transglycosylase SLT domain-containing protein [Ignavibacteriae bacterium]|nr:murein transglycosylase [Ignavibacteriota bacterium]NOG97167.1 transglycosylase SLT domain-containing protein [Ignavibacteriota bacterium]
MKELQLKITNSMKHINQPIKPKNISAAEKGKMVKAAKDFESLFTSMMLKSMTKSTGGMFGENSFGGDFYETIFQQKISSYISEKNSMGVADMMYKKLTGESLHDAELELKKIKAEMPVNKKEVDPAVESAKLKPSSGSENRLNNYESIINEASKKFNVDKNLIKSVIFTESAANVKAKSSANAKGLMQLMDSTAMDMGVKNVWDPKENIYGGTKYLGKMLRQYNGDVKLSLAAYNAGPGNVKKYNGVPPFKETENYITRVLSYYNYLNG